MDEGAVDGGDGKVRFRSKERTAERAHRPEQLVWFYLPEVEIDGLGLAGALEKLRAAYVEVCVKSGEKPLAFRFDVPDDDGLRLRMKLSGKSFSGGVRMLAGAAGMRVKRNGLTFVFERFPDDDEMVRKVAVRPDVKSRLGAMTGMEDGEAEKADLVELLERMGMQLEPGTELTLTPEGVLVIGGGDASRLQVLFGQLESEEAPGVKVTSKVIELATGVDWESRSGVFSDAEVQLFMREMAQIKGTDLMTMPSLASRGMDQTGKIEVVKEVVYPSVNADGGFESAMVGKVVDVRAGAYGFGQAVDVTFTDTEFEETGGSGRVRELTRLGAEGFSEDGATRVSVQERPDGSRAILLVTGKLIDRTGLPVRGGRR